MRGILIRLGKKLVISYWLLEIGFLVLFLWPGIALSEGQSNLTPELETILKLTNQAREENSLLPLFVSEKLNQAALNKAQDMVLRNYWSHETPEGEPFWKFVELSDYHFVYIGENLAADFENPDQIVSAWLNSDIHRKNILNEKYSDIGLANYKNIIVAFYGSF